MWRGTAAASASEQQRKAQVVVLRVDLQRKAPPPATAIVEGNLYQFMEETCIFYCPYTAADGAFEFTDLASGNYDIEVKKASFQTAIGMLLLETIVLRRNAVTRRFLGLSRA